MKKLCKTNVFKTKVATIILALTILSSGNAYGWEFGTNVWNATKSFFTARTNPFLKPTPGIIQGAKQTLFNLNSKIKILKSTYNQIPKQIKSFTKINETTIGMADKAETLTGVQKCITQYQDSTRSLINFINSNAKKTFTPVTRWFGLKTDIIEHSEYPLHNAISENGLTSGSAEYLVDVTEAQRLNLANFEKCVANVPESQNVININWFKKLITDKNIINQQAFKAILEKVKYHTRGILETITPNNPYLKYALIAGSSTYLAYKLYKGTIYKLWKRYRKETPKQLKIKMATLMAQQEYNQAELKELTVLNDGYGRDNLFFKTIGLGTAATAIVALVVKAFEMNQIQPYIFGK